MKEVKTKRRIMEGVVISDKMQKTIVVEIEQRMAHPMYQKQVKYTKKYKVHDPESIAKVGDKVRIIESRPYSKEKRFLLLEKIQ
ncbi:MAG: 30S ribosomal protein S17 [Candidatus Omnitrophica bacterium]|nr:30S ribosomal protein S17 [Candidatus Omnitrophota bacterium]